MGAALNSRVVVVGAGISGAACANALSASGVHVVHVDRGRVAGGRMSSPQIKGRRVDLGAAYFTVRDERFRAVVARWHEAGLAREWTDTFDSVSPGGERESRTGPMRWAAPRGLRSLVHNLLRDHEVDSGVSVTRVDAGPRVEGFRADAVVLAMPDPQARRVISADLPAVRAAAGELAWAPVIAVAAGYAERSWPITDAAFVDHPDLSMIADDGSRRGDGAPVLVLHSSTALAADHLADPAGAVGPMLQALRAALGVEARPAWTVAHRWGIARPETTHDGAPFYLGEDMVGLCGDSWTVSDAPRVESAWLSGHLLGERLAARLHAPALNERAPERDGASA